MKQAVVYIHGKGGCAGEAVHFRPLFPYCDVIGLEYAAKTPWEAKEELPGQFDALCEGYDSVILVGESIGAWFAMIALADKDIDEAYFISPVADMERVICDMMAKNGVTEEELLEKGEIETPSGETLSMEYLRYVREHPVCWNVPTHILYGGKDELTALSTMTDFAEKAGATLTLMKNGEHWFHTEEQIKYMDEWIRHI